MSISSLKKAELIELVNKQALQVADLKDALLAAQNAVTDAKHREVLVTEQLSQLETAYGYAVSDNAELVAEIKGLVSELGMREEQQRKNPNHALGFRSWAMQQAENLGKTIRVDIRRQLVVVDGREIKYQPS